MTSGNTTIPLFIDPYMLTEGDAIASMLIEATLNGTKFFSGQATLDHGSLSTAGNFSHDDFDLQTLGSKFKATLITEQFYIPFDVVQSNEYQFGIFQEFIGNAADGGIAMVGTVPEPATLTLLLLGSGMAGLAGARKKFKK